MSAAISQAYWVCTVLPCIRIYIVVLTGKFFGFSFSCCQICTYGCTFWTILQTKLVGWDVVLIFFLVIHWRSVLKQMIQGAICSQADDSGWKLLTWHSLKIVPKELYRSCLPVEDCDISRFIFFRDYSDDPLWITLLYEDSFLIEFSMFKSSLESHMQLGSRHTLLSLSRVIMN